MSPDQLGQRATAGQAAGALHQRGLNGKPRLARLAGDRSRIDGRPFPGEPSMPVGPSQNRFNDQRRRPWQVANAAPSGEELGQRSARPQTPRAVAQRQIDVPPVLAWASGNRCRLDERETTCPASHAARTAGPCQLAASSCRAKPRGWHRCSTNRHSRGRSVAATCSRYSLSRFSRQTVWPLPSLQENSVGRSPPGLG
jgi:hypothetical protein